MENLDFKGPEWQQELTASWGDDGGVDQVVAMGWREWAESRYILGVELAGHTNGGMLGWAE